MNSSLRLVHPESLSALRADLLMSWLRPAREYFQNRGLDLEAAFGAGHGSARDYEALARMLVEPDEHMPAAILESLWLIERMSTPAGMDLIIRAAAGKGLGLELDEEATPADVALKAWLLDPALLEHLRNCHELTRPRAFRYFSTDADPVPAFSKPAAEQITALEQRLNSFYTAWRRGPGARVLVYDRSPEWWFLVRHGAPFCRQPALRAGQPTTVSFRPQQHDVLVYDTRRGEMRLHCCSHRERNVLLSAFGLHLFGRKDFFPLSAKYTLAPLVRRGRDCLACADVPGLERVRLTEVEFYFREAPWQRVIRQADDIFQLVENQALRWPSPLEAITRATFEFKFQRSKRPRRVTIVPCNKALYGRDQDSSQIERWFQARQFAVDENPTDGNMELRESSSCRA
jgi:hypothetical protein